MKKCVLHDREGAVALAFDGVLRETLAELSSARARIARLEEALTPFAVRASSYYDYADDSSLEFDGGPRVNRESAVHLCVRDLRRARAALGK